MKAISEETTVAIQGYGSVGANAARLLDKWGATVVAISDVNGAMYDPEGIDTAQFHHTTRSLKPSQNTRTT